MASTEVTADDDGIATIPQQAISAQAYLLTTISMLLCLGMPLVEVIRSATAASA
jgi:predicted amidohydrolase